MPPGLAPVQLATAGLLDELTAQGGLGTTTVFDNVGYGLVPSFKQGPPQFAYPPGRLFSTSRFKGLTQKFLKLNMNSELEGNGGGCYGDSGSPKFIHDTSTAVAIATGGDPICPGEQLQQPARHEPGEDVLRPVSGTAVTNRDETGPRLEPLEAGAALVSMPDAQRTLEPRGRWWRPARANKTLVARPAREPDCLTTALLLLSRSSDAYAGRPRRCFGREGGASWHAIGSRVAPAIVDKQHCRPVLSLIVRSASGRRGFGGVSLPREAAVSAFAMRSRGVATGSRGLSGRAG